MTRDLMKHEAAHAWGCFVGGAARAVIEEEADGRYWRTTPVWREGAEPGELATMTGYLAGPLCYPEAASGEDRFLLHVIRSQQPELFRQIEHICREAVLPAVEGITDAQLDHWVSRIEAGEKVHIRRTEGN